MSRMAAAWRQIDDERRAVLDRRLRKQPMSLGGVVSKLHDEGAAWIAELGKRRGGITPDEVGELTILVATTAATNMGALVRAGALSPEDGAAGGVGAGVGVGLLAGYDLGRREALVELEQIIEAIHVDGHRDEGDLDRAVGDVLEHLRRELAR